MTETVLTGQRSDTDGVAHANGVDGSGSVRPRALVLRAAGTNCARETALACEAAGLQADTVLLGELAAAPQRLFAYGLLVLPGGFAYGDYLGAGILLAAELRAALGTRLDRFVADGGLILGICNGFQVLARLGLLPDVALAPNERGHFECRWIALRAEPHSTCIFTRGLERLALPVAHGEGRLVVRDPAALERLAADRCVALRYIDATGAPTQEYPANPNGSLGAIAGLCNAAGTVLGLMPHPERAALPLQPSTVGLSLFRNAAHYLARQEVSSVD